MNCTLRTKAYAPKKKKRGGAQENHRLMGALRWVKGARREGILAGADSPATHRTAAAPGRGGPLPANACGVAALTAAADAARSLTAALTAEVLQQVSKAKGACIPPPPTITEGSGRGQVHRSSSGGQRTAHEETRQRQSQHRASAHSAKRPSSTTLRQALNGHGGHPRPPAPPHRRCHGRRTAPPTRPTIGVHPRCARRPVHAIVESCRDVRRHPVGRPHRNGHPRVKQLELPVVRPRPLTARRAVGSCHVHGATSHRGTGEAAKGKTSPPMATTTRTAEEGGRENKNENPPAPPRKRQPLGWSV